MEEISKESVRRFLVLKQGFLQQKGNKDGTLEAIRQLECVQVDPINVVHRNHHLVLHNRVADYRPAYLEKLLYKDRRVFEYWCNEKSIIPIEDYPYFRYRMQNPSLFHSPFYERVKARKEEMKHLVSHVLSQIERSGPLSTREFKHGGKIKGRVATSVLNLLWDCGDLMIHHVEGNRRYYDLAVRLLPPNMDVGIPSREEYERFMIRKYMRAYGLVDTRSWRFGWLPMKTFRRKVIVKEMVEDGELCQVKIAGVEHVYHVLKGYLCLLEDPDTFFDEKVHFVAPLDNLLWNRRMISEVFDFDYSWEVYKSLEKRVYGYYVMPILCGTRFIGRFDPKLDRQNKMMIVNSLFLEQEFGRGSLAGELAAALERFLRFHEVSEVNIRKTSPKEVKHALLRELS